MVVCVLFGVMNLAALCGAVSDVRERRYYSCRLQTAEVGFRVAEDGAWLWRFAVDPLVSQRAAPSGPAVAMCHLLGIPFARLRCALPDEMLTWGLGEALGRSFVLSERNLARIESEKRRLHDGSRKFFARRPSVPRLSSPTAISPERLSKASVPDHPFGETLVYEEFIGTALVLGFLQAAMLMPWTELKKRQAAAVKHFEGITTPAGADFKTTLLTMVSLTMAGILTSRSEWLLRARLFKLVLSQSADGFWDPCASAAFASLARVAAEVDAVPMRRLTALNRIITSVFDSEGNDDGGNDDVDALSNVYGTAAQQTRLQRRTSEAVSARRQSIESRLSEATALPSSPVTRVEDHEDTSLSDCPLSFSASAFEESLPPLLTRLAGDVPELPLLRIWTTLCCIATLEKLHTCWIAGDGDVYFMPERTIVDAGREWVECTVARAPLLAKACEAGLLRKEANLVVDEWQEAWQFRVSRVRSEAALTKKRMKSYVERVLLSMARAITSKHETFRTILSEPDEGLQRWQSFMLLFTLGASCAQN